MPFPPTVYLIGAQKAGTTFLSFLLDQHPQIVLSKPKEPDFYTRNYDKGLGWYRDKFEYTGPEILIDASTSYTAAHVDNNITKAERKSSNLDNVPERIHSISPDARFIYILRNPVERTYSSYWHDVRQGNEHRPFMDAIQKDSSYLRISNYAAQLEKYFHYFPKEAFCIVFFEELKKTPVAIAQQCFHFLGLNDEIELTLDRGRNKSFVYHGYMNYINRILSPIGGLNYFVTKTKPFVTKSLIQYVSKLITKEIPEIKPHDKQYLIEYFKEKNRMLEELIGKKIDKWNDV
jgi:hypothetical protein